MALEEKILVPGEAYGRHGPLVRYFPTFFSKSDADRLYYGIRKSFETAKQEKGLFGNPAFRRTIQVGDDGIRPYKYSGSSAEEVFPWEQFVEVKEIRERIQQELGVRINLVLVNFYPMEANLAWHSDDEDDSSGPGASVPMGMVDGSTIVSVSFGTARRFSLRELPPGAKKKGPTRKWVLDKKTRRWYKPILAHGSVITMEGDCQQLLEHCVPKMVITDIVTYGGMRINLTFRLMQDK